MKNSCTVSDVPIYLKQNNAEYTGCAEWRQAMVKRVSGIEGLDAVVIGRWMDYRSLALNPDGSRTTPETVGELWREAWRGRSTGREGGAEDRGDP